MKCLRCGYCCLYLWIIVIKDPRKPISEDNWQEVNAQHGKPCPHFRGNKPGKYSCAIHNFPRYKETPCFSHGQIERSKKDLCRMGKYILKEEAKKMWYERCRGCGKEVPVIENPYSKNIVIITRDNHYGLIFEGYCGECLNPSLQEIERVGKELKYFYYDFIKEHPIVPIGG